MITRTARSKPIGGMPPIVNPIELVGLAGGRPADLRLARDGGQPRDIDAVLSGDEADDRFRARHRTAPRRPAT